MSVLECMEIFFDGQLSACFGHLLHGQWPANLTTLIARDECISCVQGCVPVIIAIIAQLLHRALCSLMSSHGPHVG